MAQERPVGKLTPVDRPVGKLTLVEEEGPIGELTPVSEDPSFLSSLISRFKKEPAPPGFVLTRELIERAGGPLNLLEAPGRALRGFMAGTGEAVLEPSKFASGEPLKRLWASAKGEAPVSGQDLIKRLFGEKISKADVKVADLLQNVIAPLRFARREGEGVAGTAASYLTDPLTPFLFAGGLRKPKLPALATKIPEAIPAEFTVKEAIDLPLKPASKADELFAKHLPSSLQRESAPGKFLEDAKSLLERRNILPIAEESISKETQVQTISDPVQKVISALKEVKPLRGQQEAIFSAERGKRIAKVMAVGGKVPGERGFHAQLAQLKGELPKVKFESLRGKISQLDIDELFNQVERSRIPTPFEKISAKGGLSKILGAEGGSLPTEGELKLLSEVFPAEFIQEVLAKRPFIQKLWSGTVNALNLPRAMMATADLSAPFRQGLFLVGRPKQFLPAFKDMFKFAFSEDAYKGMIQSIQSRPTYQLMRESKLALTDLSNFLGSREEAFMSNLAERIPLFGKVARGSNRAHSGFLTKLRADVFDDLLTKATKQGLLRDNPKITQDIARFVNSATGRGDLKALSSASSVLNAAFFSPRLMASRLNLLNPVFYVKLNPFVRKEALKSLFSLAGTGMTLLGLAKLGGADVETDSRSADFGKAKFGNTRYDLWGGFQQYLVLASRLLTGETKSTTSGKITVLGKGYKPTTRLDIIGRFLRSKEAPIVSFATDMLSGRDAMGRNFEISKEIADRFVPMVASDMYDLYKEEGPLGPLAAIPGIFGTGVQTYRPRERR